MAYMEGLHVSQRVAHGGVLVGGSECLHWVEVDGVYMEWPLGHALNELVIEALCKHTCAWYKWQDKIHASTHGMTHTHAYPDYNVTCLYGTWIDII
jgi:hypothetical protein